MFCGAGGMDLGLRSAGFELAYANDVNPRACESFERNLGHAPVVGDIREQFGDEVGDVDVLTGGFPCVTFSTAGHRRGVVDDKNGKLYLELCRMVREVRPRYFVAENVRGILSANNGAAVKLVLAAFLRLGYRVEYQLVNMAEHGVPQIRTRVIFVGVRLDEWRGSFVFPGKTHRLADDKAAAAWLPRAIGVGAAIGDLGDPVIGGNEANHEPNDYRVIEGYATTSRTAPAGEPAPAMVSDSPNAQPFVKNHDPNDAPIPPNYAVGRRHAPDARPAPTITDGHGGVNAPLVDNHAASGSRSDGKPHGSGKRFANTDEPSPSIVAADGGGPPLVANHVAGRGGHYEGHGVGGRAATADEPSPTVMGTHGAGAPEIQNHVACGAVETVYGVGDRHQDEADPSATVAAAGGSGVPWKDRGVRRMSVRECARVQTFPDWFVFAGPMSEGYKQVGNAVPPLYAKRLGLALLEYDRRPRMGER